MVLFNVIYDNIWHIKFRYIIYIYYMLSKYKSIIIICKTYSYISQLIINYPFISFFYRILYGSTFIYCIF